MQEEDPGSPLQQPEKTPLLHGEAIAIGMICEAYLSNQVSGLTAKELKEITTFILSVYKPVKIKADNYNRFLELMQHDKKNEKGKINFSLLSTIGKCEINVGATAQQIKDSLNYYSQQAKLK